ncbi:hypothetical protein UCDDA912_g04343 [Diaporthe ampelina]|uniref:Myb-like domain-containing protein n=1 Tax=Diaporthe ampelina TaxID=1214573 RepID=A0A0G2I7C8_9PEZI|nr:hypothetical protein UCDDA912_g04343 [Diaporthe ampelina]
MNDQELPSIAQKAIEHVLRYHDSCHPGLTERYKAVIQDKIEALLPLKSLAADPDVANIEIVSDAAMSFVDVYNPEHPGNPLNQKWLYIGVQTLASIDLKPDLVRGEVRRLPEVSIETEARTDDPVADRHDIPQPDETEDDAVADPKDISHKPPAPPAFSDGATPRDEQAPAGDSEPPPAKTPRSRKRRSSGPRVANGKDPWGDEEIKKLIKWKVQGMTHKEVGAKLGRTEPACAIRHSIVLKQAQWMDYSRAYREKRAAGEISDGEDENVARDEGEQVKEDQEMRDAEDKEDEQVENVEETTTYESPKDVEMEENGLAQDK